jgi:hypothetical protein
MNPIPSSPSPGRAKVRAKAVIAQMALNDSDPSVRSVATDMLDSLEDQEQKE